jgi:hypothetical protein
MSDQKNVARRSFLVGATSTILCAPAIVRATSLMPVRGLIMAIDASESMGVIPRPQEGFVRRLLFASCDRDLQSGRRESSFRVNSERLSEKEMRDLVGYARRHGFLA